MSIIDYAKTFCGKQETEGSNLGPMLRKWKMEVFGLHSSVGAVSWCGIFVFAMLMEYSKKTRKELVTKLGFDAKTFYPESTDSWLQQGTKSARITTEPKVGDIFLWMVPQASGFSKTDAHHIGFIAEAFTPKDGAIFQTLEGNTTAVGTNLASREGDGVYRKSRTYRPGAFIFLSIPALV